MLTVVMATYARRGSVSAAAPPTLNAMKTKHALTLNVKTLVRAPLVVNVQSVMSPTIKLSAPAPQPPQATLWYHT